MSVCEYWRLQCHVFFSLGVSVFMPNAQERVENVRFTFVRFQRSQRQRVTNEQRSC